MNMFWFRYYMAPFSSIRHFPKQRPHVSLWVHIALLSFSQLYLQPFGGMIALWKQWVFLVMFILIFLLVQTWVIDFTVNYAFGKSHSVYCFYLFSFAWYPLLIKHTFVHLGVGLPAQVMGIINIAIIGLIVCLYICSIQRLYSLTKLQSCMVLLSPLFILFIMGIVTSMVIIT